ncbi:unnamed protein product [Cuscuta epithymum]|uniref:Uncharacterized protein n=1 Tax=Cuscuta epithymum TaxID=186058 RepID=A0AAV0F494_9ASTE|nr:unnamed protein product [Cuscuta epithymum]
MYFIQLYFSSFYPPLSLCVICSSLLRPCLLIFIVISYVRPIFVFVLHPKTLQMPSNHSLEPIETTIDVDEVFPKFVSLDLQCDCHAEALFQLVVEETQMESEHDGDDDEKPKGESEYGRKPRFFILSP